MSRKEKQYHYIYKTVNQINGKFYIGIHSTNDLNDGYVGSGKRLWYSINKYGKENFKCEILEYFSDRELLYKKEKELVNEELLKDKMCMNLGIGGTGGQGDRFLTKEQLKKGRKKCDLILKEKYGENFKSIISKNFYNNLTQDDRKSLNEKIKIGQQNSNYDFGSSFKGKKHNEITKQKIGIKNSIKQKGENNSQYSTMWITNGVENKKVKKNSEIPLDWYKGRNRSTGSWICTRVSQQNEVS